MLIDESLFLPIVAVVGILAAVVIYFLLRKKVRSRVLNIFVIIIAFFVFVLLKSMGQRVYVVDGDLQIKNYRAFGSFTVEMEDKEGAKVTCEISPNRIGVVNKSGKTLVVEEIIYTENDSDNNNDKYQYQQIPPYSFQEILSQTGQIDYFFDEEIPEEIAVREPSSFEAKYWIYVMTENP